jgi:hypothetical protein
MFSKRLNSFCLFLVSTGTTMPLLQGPCLMLRSIKRGHQSRGRHGRAGLGKAAGACGTLSYYSQTRLPLGFEAVLQHAFLEDYCARVFVIRSVIFELSGLLRF